MIDLPNYAEFRAVCERGLSMVRPLTEAARDRDPAGWNFGSGWPPSHAAFGRMRTLVTMHRAAAAEPRRSLEIAAGDAAQSACLALRGVAAWANDLREDALRDALASYQNAASITLLPGDIFALDVARTGSFDLLLACEVIEHVAHPDRLLCHLREFLTSEGRLLLTTPNGGYFRSPLPTLAAIQDRDALEKIQFRPDADGHLFLLTADELIGLAEDAGLVIEELDLFGTPLLTGHLGMVRLRSPGLTPISYAVERAMRRAPRYLKQKLCFGIIAVMRRK